MGQGGLNVSCEGLVYSHYIFLSLLHFNPTQSPPAQMSDPGPSPGGAQAKGIRPDENRSNNPHVSRNLCRQNQSCNQNRCIGGNPSTYEGKQTEIKDHIYDVGGTRGGNDLFNKTPREIAEFVSRTIKGGGEFITAMDPDALGFQPLDDPVFPDDDADKLEIERWKLCIRRTDERHTVRDEVT